LASWKLLFTLCGAASSDAFVSTARAMWPKDQNVGLKIISTMGSDILPILSIFAALILNNLRNSSPFSVYEICRNAGLSVKGGKSVSEPAAAILIVLFTSVIKQ
jgi:hypothetical protein